MTGTARAERTSRDPDSRLSSMPSEGRPPDMDKVEVRDGKTEEIEIFKKKQLEIEKKKVEERAKREALKAKKKKRLKWKQRRELAKWSSWILFLWVAIGWLFFDLLSKKPDPKAVPPGISDFATIFFGASSLALVIVSLVLAFVAIVGWNYIKEEVSKEIKASEEAKYKVQSALDQNREVVGHLTASVETRFKRIQEEKDELVGDLKENTDKLAGEIQEKTSSTAIAMKEQAENIRSEIQDKADVLIKEIKGRSKLVSGHTVAASIASRYQVKADDLVKESPITGGSDKIQMQEAVYVSLEAYQELAEAGSKGQYAALNNVVYYSCVLRLDSNREELLAQGRKIREVGELYKTKQSSIPYLMNFCWVMLIYGSNMGEVAEALTIGEEMLKREDIISFQREEATDLVASLKKKFKELLGSVTD